MFKNIIPSLFLFLLAELYIFKEDFLVFFTVFSFSLLLFFSWYFLKKASLVTIISFLPLIEFPILNLLSEKDAKHLTAVLFSFFAYLLFKSIPKKSHIIIISFFEFLLGASLLFVFLLSGADVFLSESILFFLMFFLSFSLFFSSILSVLKLELFLKIRLFNFSVIVGILMVEFFWILLKFPFNFLTSGFILFLIYYVICDITIRYFANNLTKKSILKTSLFLLLVFVSLLVTVKLFLI